MDNWNIKLNREWEIMANRGLGDIFMWAMLTFVVGKLGIGIKTEKNNLS